MLDSEELVGFFRLHESIAGLGGTLDSTVGAVVRGLIEEMVDLSAEGSNGMRYSKVNENQQLDRTVILQAYETACPFIFVGRGTYTSYGVAGVVLRKVSGNKYGYRKA